MSLAQLDCSHTLSWDDLFYWACFAVCSRSNDDLSFSLSLHFSLSKSSLLSLFFSCSPFYPSPPPSHTFCSLSPLLFLSIPPSYFLPSTGFSSFYSSHLCFSSSHTSRQYISWFHVLTLQLYPHHSVHYHLFCSLSLSVGGAFVLGTYTILFLKLYSYKDVNMWCRELSTVKAKKLARSLSCKSQTHLDTHTYFGKRGFTY